MRNLKISIIGNSVAVRIRPPEKYPENKNYGIQLEELLQKEFPEKNILVNNLGFSRATMIDMKKKIDDYICEFPDYYIINSGISDASTREIPFWFAEIINNKKDSVIKTIFLLIHHVMIKKRTFFVKLRGSKPWISENKFKTLFSNLIQTLIKETNAKIIVLSMNRPTKRIEKILRGSTQNCDQYNDIFRSVAKKYNLIFLDLDFLNPDIHYPDGIHFSKSGHKIVSEKLFEIIVNNVR